MFRTLRRKVFRFALVSGAGAAATYFFDSERGQQRREEAKQKADSLLKRSPATPAWQPERTANVFDTPAATTAATQAAAPVTEPVTAPTISDIIVTPEREVDPLSTRP
jgi:hypothetical protein